MGGQEPRYATDLWIVAVHLRILGPTIPVDSTAAIICAVTLFYVLPPLTRILFRFFLTDGHRDQSGPASSCEMIQRRGDGENMIWTI